MPETISQDLTFPLGRRGEGGKVIHLFPWVDLATAGPNDFVNALLAFVILLTPFLRQHHLLVQRPKREQSRERIPKATHQILQIFLPVFFVGDKPIEAPGIFHPQALEG